MLLLFGALPMMLTGDPESKHVAVSPTLGKYTLSWTPSHALSREKGEAIGRYSEKEKKTFLKKGSNNLLNEFHEGRN